MSRRLISLHAAVLAVFIAAPAQAVEWTPIRTADGGSQWAPIPGTARIYRNSLGTMQADLQFQYTNRRTGYTTRVRQGVTGCPESQGQTAEVGQNGDTLTEPMTWARQGEQAADGIAALVCDAARAQYGGGAQRTSTTY